jgi:hypothetical protein
MGKRKGSFRVDKIRLAKKVTVAEKLWSFNHSRVEKG